MKKYYGYFVYDDREYVIRFKIKGSLEWDSKAGCFIDDRWYTWSITEVIALVIGHNPISLKAFSCAFLLTHEEFVEERARGVIRWVPKKEIIDWD